MLRRAARVAWGRAALPAPTPAQWARSLATQAGGGSPSQLSKQAVLQAAVAAGLAGWVGWTFYQCKGLASEAQEAGEEEDSYLPEFSREEVAQRRSREGGGRVWVTYRGGVYDITEFLELHPGGSGRLMMAAGGALEPWWAQYPRHHTPQVREILADYKIGRLRLGDAAEAPPTPRHLAPGGVDAATFRLRVEGAGPAPVDLSLEDLKNNFPLHRLAATVKCGSSGTTSSSSSKAGEQVGRGGSVIGTKAGEQGAGSSGTKPVVWGGALLRDVLAAAGLREGASASIAHIQLEGLDGTPIPPLEPAMITEREVLLAYELDGQPLSPAQGFPLRTVVPGVGGRRNAKWVTKVTVVRQQEGGAAQAQAPEAAAAACACET